ncbi:hypothetical protein BP00DRAFT_456916 [Aspergillus indologenus CBS 114.80]|uniref:Zn(2)-C6 fungal-type domain-containing protein n=1 Tax=Aspergillus indologenus CBS 114.80 TaxID=1450541 RepID=A0A2V5I4G8_9EURO|nr:hypothetical protein BP00DRAFT_456916 [Aspergillus indologenus CBS 114.80]
MPVSRQLSPQPGLKREMRSRRRHAVGVCNACRRRHIKCDLARPTCSACKAIGALCERSNAQLTWTSTSGPSFQGNTRAHHGPSTTTTTTTAVRRRYLYREQDRVSTSISLLSSLHTASVDNSLQQIEDESWQTALHPGQSNFIGPFGVLSLPHDPVPPSSECQEEEEEEARNSSSNSNRDETHSLEIPPPLLAGSLGSLPTAEESLHWPDILEMDMSWPELFNFNDLPSPLPEQPVSLVAEGAEQSNEDAPLEGSVQTPGPGFSLGDIQISDAQMLLKRYRDVVVAHSFSFPLSGMSPWEKLNVDSAVITLGRIAFMGTERISHAAMSNLLALLAISAVHKAAAVRKQGTTSSGHWEGVSAASYAKAKDHLQQSLRRESHNVPPPKYKEQLMALSAMLSFAILSDCQEQARAYLLDSERLLRLRGLTKRVFSRKARLLHHIYTWNRILGESTFVLRDYSKDPSLTARSAEAAHARSNPFRPNPDIHLDDFLQLDVSSNNPEPKSHRDQDGILNNVHIEESRGDSQPMYRELYGVSETWLSLVSQTTRLANFVDKLTASKGPQDPGMMDALENAKLRLEERIWKLVSLHDPPPPLGPHGPNLEGSVEHPRAYMVHALNLGLVIFFYRRIRESNPRLLQPYVSSIVQALKDFAASCKAFHLEGPGSPWPAFMAGCEAMAPQDRDYLHRWMDEALTLTGFLRFRTIKQCMEEVWRRQLEIADRRDGRVTYHSWVDTCREHNMYIMLS